MQTTHRARPTARIATLTVAVVVALAAAACGSGDPGGGGNEQGGSGGGAFTNVTKPATVETGAEVQVPSFVNVGDKIKLSAETGEYLGRQSG